MLYLHGVWVGVGGGESGRAGGSGWVRACVNVFGCVLAGCLCFIFPSGLSDSK